MHLRSLSCAWRGRQSRARAHGPPEPALGCLVLVGAKGNAEGPQSAQLLDQLHRQGSGQGVVARADRQDEGVAAWAGHV